MTLPQHAREIQPINRTISGIIPSRHRMVLQLDRQGLRPGAIAHTMGLPVGGVSSVIDVLRAYGVTPPPARKLAS